LRVPYLAAPLPSPPPLAVVSPQHYGASQNPEPASTGPASKPLSRDLTSSPKCPLGRVAMVCGGDSEASEGAGFYAARANGIHGAVDLDGFLGAPVSRSRTGKWWWLYKAISASSERPSSSITWTAGVASTVFWTPSTWRPSRDSGIPSTVSELHSCETTR